MNRAKLTFVLLLTAIFGLAGFSASAGPTAAETIAKASQGYRNAKSLSIRFSMSGSNGNTSGTFLSSGGKYAITTGAASTWFNGKQMWTYNPKSGETTLFKPSKTEIAESNPFNVLSTITSDFTAAYAKEQPAGSTVIVLRAKSTKNNIKKMVLTLDSKRLVPKKIVITSTQGNSTITVTEYAANKSIKASEFEYPKAKYPKAKIVDLR